MPHSKNYDVTYRAAHHAAQVKPLGDSLFEVTLGQAPPVKVDARAIESGLLLLKIDGRIMEVETAIDGDDVHLLIRNWDHKLVVEDQLKKQLQDALGAGGVIDKIVKAIMPGKILKLMVKEGETVKEGDSLLIMEAMKMENEIKAMRPGKVIKIFVQEGKTVETGDKLVELLTEGD